MAALNENRMIRNASVIVKAGDRRNNEGKISSAKAEFVESLAAGEVAIFPTEYVDSKAVATMLLAHRAKIKGGNLKGRVWTTCIDD